MIKHIQDAISYGLFEDFRAEDSTLVAGFHECFGEQLDCEEFSSWPDENEAAPASSVWSTHLGARTMTMPLARVAWRWASVFNL